MIHNDDNDDNDEHDGKNEGDNKKDVIIMA